MITTRPQTHGGSIEAEVPPIRIDQSGALRVGNSNVLVVLVIAEYQQHRSPEEIHEDYPTTTLADVYGVIAYYLRHQAEMDTYIAEYEREADQLRRKIEAEHGPFLEELRRRIAERTAAMKRA